MYRPGDTVHLNFHGSLCDRGTVLRSEPYRFALVTRFRVTVRWDGGMTTVEDSTKLAPYFERHAFAEAA